MGVAAVVSFWALWQRRYRLARVAAAAQVALILWGWGVAQYPYMLPPDLTIGGAAARDAERSDVRAGADENHVSRFRGRERCAQCRRIYWPATHYERMLQELRQMGIVPT